MINVWGGDIWINDDDSHQQLESYFRTIKNHIGIDYAFVKSNLRSMFNEAKLDALCKERLYRKHNHGWWASIAHILSMCSVVAPLLYALQIESHYIASSYNRNVKTFDTNNPDFISHLRFCSTSFYSLNDQISRNSKIKSIITFRKETKLPIELKVCWYRVAGKNCCSCEKCYRTIMNLVSNHENPNEYGFDVTDATFHNIHSYLLNHKVNKVFWVSIQQCFLDEREYWKNIDTVSWILNTKINSPRIYLKSLKRKIIRNNQ